MISNFDIYSDFYADPQMKLLFGKYELPSNIMWALMLFAHPDSQYDSMDNSTKKTLIETDYLQHSISWDEYSEIISKIYDHSLTKTQRLLKNWETKLEERDAFIADIQYNAETFEMLDKMMGATSKMWDNYLAILKKASSEADSQIQGDVELSLSEKGII